MQKLEEKYGNVHFIMGLLIDDIKSLPIVRRGDFRSSEKLTFHVNDFHDRLRLESCGDGVDNQKVE